MRDGQLGGPKQQAWILGGGVFFVDGAIDDPEVVLVHGLPPLLALPAAWHLWQRERRERVFGWALAELCERECGWLTLVVFVRRHAHQAALLATGLLSGLLAWLT